MSLYSKIKSFLEASFFGCLMPLLLLAFTMGLMVVLAFFGLVRIGVSGP